MSSCQFLRAVARATGESVHTIRGRGFQPLAIDPGDRDDWSEPSVFDWDTATAVPLSHLIGEGVTDAR